MLCWSSPEKIPHIQGKRNPSKMVGAARGHQRADTLKPHSQKTSKSNHTILSPWETAKVKTINNPIPEIGGQLLKVVTQTEPLFTFPYVSEIPTHTRSL